MENFEQNCEREPSPKSSETEEKFTEPTKDAPEPEKPMDCEEFGQFITTVWVAIIDPAADEARMSTVDWLSKWIKQCPKWVERGLQHWENCQECPKKYIYRNFPQYYEFFQKEIAKINLAKEGSK